MMQGIQTRYLGPTNARGSRVKATARKADAWGKAVALTDSWGYSDNSEGNHTRVAWLLAAQLGRSGVWVGAGNPDNSGYHYVNLGDVDWTPPGVAGRDWFRIARKDA